MKKIKPQYGKIIPPVVKEQTIDNVSSNDSNFENGFEDSRSVRSENEISEVVLPERDEYKRSSVEELMQQNKGESATFQKETGQPKITSQIISDPNPFLQTKEIFGKARLTKVGYRVRTDFVEILDIIKKIKKNGYTLEAVLDDALTFYFENSEDGREAIKKAEIFYS